MQRGSSKLVVGIDQSPKNIDVRSLLRLRQAADQTLVAATGMRRHLLHEPVKIFLREIAAHAAQTLRNLFANLLLTEGVEL